MEFALPGGFRGQGHGGDTLWFHSAMVTVPALNLGIFVTTNSDAGPLLSRHVARPDHRALLRPARCLAASRAFRPWSTTASVYAGTYVNDRRAYHGLEKFVFMLLGQANISVTDDGRLLTPGEGGVQAWYPDGPAGHFRSVDGEQTTAFEIRNGRAVRWFAPTGHHGLRPGGRHRPDQHAVVMAALAALAGDRHPGRARRPRSARVARDADSGAGEPRPDHRLHPLAGRSGELREPGARGPATSAGSSTAGLAHL